MWRGGQFTDTGGRFTDAGGRFTSRFASAGGGFTERTLMSSPRRLVSAWLKRWRAHWQLATPRHFSSRVSGGQPATVTFPSEGAKPPSSAVIWRYSSESVRRRDSESPTGEVDSPTG
eukprot:8146443-Pyramimonas_sp.AAC.1